MTAGPNIPTPGTDVPNPDGPIYPPTPEEAPVKDPDIVPNPDPEIDPSIDEPAPPEMPVIDPPQR